MHSNDSMSRVEQYLITPEFWAILDHLATHENPISLLVLKHQLKEAASPGYIYKVTNNLAFENYITKYRNPHRRQQKIIRLTSRGSLLHSKLKEIMKLIRGKNNGH